MKKPSRPARGRSRPRPPAPPAAAPVLSLLTEATLSHAQDATAHAPDGRVVFVEGAAPAERVEARVVQASSRFLRAAVVRVVEPGASRVEPRCPHFGRCGGCTAQHVDAPMQLASKAASFAITLRRVGGVAVESLALEEPVQVEAYGYRTRARLHVEVSSGLVHVGYRARRSHQLIVADRCPVLSPRLEALLPQLAAALAPLADGGGQRTAELVLVDAGTSILGRLIPDPDDVGRAALAAIGVGADARSVDDPEHGSRWVSAGAFQQQSEAGNRLLLETLSRWVAGDTAFAGRVLELYAGSGNLTRVLAPRAAQLTVIESHPEAAALLERAHPRARIFAGGVELALPAVEGPVDAIVVDPPRAGLGDELVARLAELMPRALLYVSCDPATFARDARALGAHGLVLGRARLFDLYPQTPHAEVIGLFSRPR